MKEALVLIGNRALMKLAFGLTLKARMCRRLPAYGVDEEGLWNHSLMTAFAAAKVARQSGLAELRDRAFTAGLVHDLGKLLIHGQLAPRMSGASGLHGEELCELERQALGYDHADAGGQLVEEWGFPVEILEAVRDHHRLGETPSDLLRCVAAGNAIVHSLDASAVGTGPSLVSSDDTERPPHEQMLDSLGFSADLAETVAADVAGSADDLFRTVIAA